MDLGFSYEGGKGADVPDHFSNRYAQRMDWLAAMWDVEHESVLTCLCKNEEYHNYPMACADPRGRRPTDFDAFRAKYREIIKPDQVSVFDEMTDWLEQHPGVYVDFSY